MISKKIAATSGLAVPAAMALGMSADTSYRFLGTALGITHPLERGLLTGTAEAAVVALALYTWATGMKGAARLAYACVLVQSVPAFRVSGGTGGMVRTALGPVLLVVLLHLLLGLELRLSRSGPVSLTGAALRELKERLTAYLGIGRRGQDSAAIARSRAADRAVRLTAKVDRAKNGARKDRLTARLADALDRAQHGLDTAEAMTAEAVIVSRVVRRKSASGLAGIGNRRNWDELYRDADPVSGTRPVAPVVPETRPVAPVVPETRPVAPVRNAPAVPKERPVAPAVSETPVSETQTLLTVAEAAVVASQVRGETVTPSTIRTWKHRGRLSPALDGDTLFERDAVVSAATRK